MPSIDKSEILFIVNPNCGKKNPLSLIKQIESSNIQFVVTKDKTDLEFILKKKLDDFKVFVAAGGDGTVNELMKYLVNRKDKALGVFPTGSGNGFANELNFGNDLQSLISDILVGKTIDIDVLEVNNRKCINMAGLGFDSYVAHSFQNRNERGLRNYILTTTKSIFQFKPFDAIINTSEGEISGKFQMITIANTRQFGNNAIISPTSKPNDGVFEIVLVKPFPVYLYPLFITRMFLGTLEDSDYVKYIRETKSVAVFSKFNKFHIDGEPFLSDNTLKITICKNCIRIVRTSSNLLN